MSMLARLVSVLKRPLFGTRVIPAGARVDPSQFSEDEFPVYCPKCDYLLRGLPAARCPECGADFDRGKLLVEQYVTVDGLPRLRRGRLNRLAYWVAMAGLCLVGIGGYGIRFATRRYMPQLLASGNAQAVNTFQARVELVSLLVCVLEIVALAALLCWAGITIRAYWAGRLKRRRIVDAI